MNSTAIWGFIGGFVRTALASAAGYLVNVGIIDKSQTDTTVGAVMIVGALVWSLLNKYVLHAAAGNITPVGTTPPTA